MRGADGALCTEKGVVRRSRLATIFTPGAVGRANITLPNLPANTCIYRDCTAPCSDFRNAIILVGTAETLHVERLVEWRGGISPPRSPRTGL